MLEKLKQFDAYSKTSDEYKVKTFSGATSELNTPPFFFSVL